MLSSVTLQNAAGVPVSLHTDTPATTTLLKTATGLVGIGTPRLSQRVRPQAHGAINETVWEDGRTVTLEGEVWSTAGSGQIEAALAAFRAITLPMMQTLDVGPALLQWTEGAAGNQLQMLVKLNAPVEPVLQEAMGIVAYHAEFYAEDPRAYTQAQTTVTSTALSVASGGLIMPFTLPFVFSGSAGGTLSVVNAGNRDTPLVFKINGACTNPRIVAGDGSGRQLVLVGSIADGQYVQVDTQARSVTLNGSASQPLYNFVNSAASQWFNAPAMATTTYRLVADSWDASASLSCLYRSAYS